MDDRTLFDLGPAADAGREASKVASGRPRLLKAERRQVLLRPLCLEDLLSEDHPARDVWDLVQGCDLSAWYDSIESREGKAGHPAIDPRVLLALWIWATLDGVGSARGLARLCEQHAVYQWLSGGLEPNHHTLADFRHRHPERLDALLSQIITNLLSQGHVTMKRVAQDGVRVRANASSSSFRRRPSLEGLKAEVDQQLALLKQELASDPAAGEARIQAARQRAAEERSKRVEQALARIGEEEQRKAQRVKKRGEAPQKLTDPSTAARVSTTDPEATRMKMGDGGCRPAYNVQFVTDTSSQIVLGVSVSNRGNDYGEMTPMNERLQSRYGRRPEEYLVDGGFVTLEDITNLGSTSPPTHVYSPLPKSKSSLPPEAPRATDSAAVCDWRARMATPEGQAIYRQRASTSECVNAQARNRGLQQFRVRGTARVRAVSIWYAIAHNIRRMLSERWKMSPG